MTQSAHLNIIRDRSGNYFVEVACGADRIDLTPPMDSIADAQRALSMIRAATGLPAGRTL